MRNFKIVVIFIIMFICVENVFSFMLEPVTYKHQLNQDLKVQKERGITPDLLIIGDSTVRSGLDPRIFPKCIPGIKCAINAETSSQSLCGTYYYLKDITDKYPIKIAVVGLSYWQFMKSKEKTLKKDFVVLDRITSPILRMEYASKIMTMEEWPLLLKSRQYCDNFSEVPINLQMKLSPDYIFGKTGEKEALLMGYVPLKDKMGMGNVGIKAEEMKFPDEGIDPESYLYLKKIIELCNKKRISLHFVSMPVVSAFFYLNPEIEEINDEILSLTKKSNFYFDDLNLLKARKKIFPDERMNSTDHLSEQSAEQVTAIYAMMIKNEISGLKNEHDMYPSISDARSAMNNVMAVDFHTEPAERGNRKIVARSIAKKNVYPEYRFSILDEDKKEHVLQDYSLNSECILPSRFVGKKGIIRVDCKTKNENESEVYYQIIIDATTWEK